MKCIARSQVALQVSLQSVCSKVLISRDLLYDLLVLLKWQSSISFLQFVMCTSAAVKQSLALLLQNLCESIAAAGHVRTEVDDPDH